MSDLQRRILVSSITVCLIGLFIFFAFHPLWSWIVSGFVALLAGIAIWEYEQFVKAKGGQMTLPVLIVLSVMEVMSFYLGSEFEWLQSLPISFFFVAFLILFAWHFGEKEGAIVNLAVSSFGLLYIAVPVGMILGVLYSQGVDGRWWLIYLLVVTKITDVGAYFAGSLWGKRKLAPAISPKKTIEGAAFGLFCAVCASFIFHLASDWAGTFHLGTWEWIFLGLILGVTGQFGDLSESLLKRDANKKDSNALPGLGGVLDALDSIIFTTPIIYIYLHFIKI